MTTSEQPAVPSHASLARFVSPGDRKPHDSELDLYGMTHIGKVRKVNQDHFLVCSMRKQIDVLMSSLPDLDNRKWGPDRLALLAMVADGVGGGATGEEASRLAVELTTEYLAQSLRCYSTADETDEIAFAKALELAALECHRRILQRAEDDPALHGMATTLTLWIGVWPRSYLLQVGDSRCYVLHKGELTQISRDQTMAQELIDLGVLARDDAAKTRWANVLSSSLGGPQTEPVVHRLVQSWGNVGMLCSDGLTKHVPDVQIRDRLRAMTSARQACEALVQDALDGGGTDNITVVIGRTLPRAD
jgi:serine/threonine protein phosphatase PrpC